MPKIDVNIPTKELLDGFVGRRVEIGPSDVPTLRNLRGKQGLVTTWRYNNIAESGVLFYITLEDGRKKCACWYELRFLLPRLDTTPTNGDVRAEGGLHG